MDQNTSTVPSVPLLFPESVIPSKFSNQVIVSDVLIPRGTMFGPYPGDDTLEKKYNNWMQHVTSVTDYWEANLLVAFSKNQLYFHCSRNICAGTELIVWGGQKKIHLRDPSEWTTFKMDKTSLTFVCQECDLNFKTTHSLVLHINKSHVTKKMPEKNCKCPHCPYVGYKIDLRKHLVRHGINLYGNPLVIDQNKTTVETEDSATTSESQLDSKPNSESDFSQSDSESESDSAKKPTARNETIAEKYEYKCKLCKKTFERPQQLYGHLGKAHKQNKSIYGKMTSVKKSASNGDCNARKLSTDTYESSWKQKKIGYMCNICENSFATSKSLRHHVNSIHLGIRFVCSVCSCEYTLKYTLTKHIKKCHNLQANVLIMQNGKILY